MRWMVLKSCEIFLSVKVNHCDQLIVVKRMCCVQFREMLDADAASVKEPHTVQGCVGAGVGEPHTTTDRGQDHADIEELSGGRSCGHVSVGADVDVEELCTGQSHGHVSVSAAVNELYRGRSHGRVGADVKELSSGQSRSHIAADADVEELRTGCDVSIQCQLDVDAVLQCDDTLRRDAAVQCDADYFRRDAAIQNCDTDRPATCAYCEGCSQSFVLQPVATSTPIDSQCSNGNNDHDDDDDVYDNDSDLSYEPSTLSDDLDLDCTVPVHDLSDLGDTTTDDIPV